MPAAPFCTEPFGGPVDLCLSCGGQQVRAGVHTCRLMEAHSPAMLAILRQARAVAQTSAPVVLLGETGTGKEVLARTLHYASPRKAAPFVPVNCGAIPGELLESELFGHVRGAFSGAVVDKPGLFEAAAGGTLLLDEVGDLPHALQVKLLRVLQDGEIRRVGSNRSTAVDVRVIAATHKDLAALVAGGQFRADLYYRIKVISLRLPALRERPEDILPLARQFLARERGPDRHLTATSQDLLTRYGWPGNIRELANAMRCAAALAEDAVVAPEHLPEEIVHAGAAQEPPPALRTLAEVEQAHVLAVLRACGGVQADAARILGIGRNTLWRKLRAYGEAADEAPALTPAPCAWPPAHAAGPAPRAAGALASKVD